MMMWLNRSVATLIATFQLLDIYRLEEKQKQKQRKSLDKCCFVIFFHIFILGSELNKQYAKQVPTASLCSSFHETNILLANLYIS